ncbi:MAG: hypothetical protein LBI05_00455 [Planctomycetaceae bacterium]|nr:hypothetical protein [Planctomycetaceae bacterium]
MSGKLMRISLAAAILAVCLGYFVASRGGCSPLRSGKGYNLSRHDFGIPFLRFSGAEMLRNIKTEELITEVENVIEQDGLPADVFYGLSSRAPDKEKQTQRKYDAEREELQQHNIAVTLFDLFQEYDTSGEPNDMSELWKASPIGEWDVDEQKLESVKTILTKLDVKRQTIRKKLKDDEQTCFYYIFVRPESRKSSKTSSEEEDSSWSGTWVNTWASKYLADYALLEEYVIAQALLDGDIDSAIDALAYMFRIAQVASALDNVGVRGDAAVVRIRAFDVMQRVILDPRFEKKHMIRLRDLLTEQYENWTSEYFTWFGDRASGLMLYQRISLNGLDALEQTEIEGLVKRRINNSADEDETRSMFNQGFRKYHEADAAFYLRSMQAILDVSGKPLKSRQNVLNQINQELVAMKDRVDDDGIVSEYVVAYVLLKDVDRLMELFAKDQSALIRAFTAVLRSLGQNNTDSYLDPFTGKPYEVEKEQGFFRISTTMLPHPFRVPNFSALE